MLKKNNFKVIWYYRLALNVREVFTHRNRNEPYKAVSKSNFISSSYIKAYIN